MIAVVWLLVVRDGKMRVGIDGELGTDVQVGEGFVFVCNYNSDCSCVSD